MKSLAAFAIIACLLTTPTMAQDEPHKAEQSIKLFPEAAEGMVRYVILLPEKTRDEEGDFRVELIVGKKMMTDGVNHVHLFGNLEEKTAESWGFSYYEFPEFGPAVSSLKGVPTGTPKVEKLVTIQPLYIRYYSRLPLVVYVPEGGEVHYRIWTAAETTAVAEEG